MGAEESWCVLLPLCGARWFGGQIIHDPGDAGDFLDLIHHFQHHLLWDMIAGHGGDAGHEVAGDKCSDHHRAPAGWLLLQWVTVKVQGGEDDRHLADLTRIAGFSKNRVSYKVSLSERAQNACGQESWGNVCRRLLHMGPKHVHNSVNTVAHTRDESSQKHERFPVWRFFTCDAADVAVGPAVTLDANSFDGQ